MNLNDFLPDAQRRDKDKVEVPPKRGSIAPSEAIFHALSATPELAAASLERINEIAEVVAKDLVAVSPDRIATNGAKSAFRISISDGYVEYEYDFNVGNNNSISSVCGQIEAALGVVARNGKLRSS